MLPAIPFTVHRNFLRQDLGYFQLSSRPSRKKRVAAAFEEAIWVLPIVSPTVTLAGLAVAEEPAAQLAGPFALAWGLSSLTAHWNHLGSPQNDSHPVLPLLPRPQIC